MELVLDFRPTEKRPADRIEAERCTELADCFHFFVSHELINTLAPLQGFTRLLAGQEDSLDEEGRMLIDRIAVLAHKAESWSRRLTEIGKLLRQPVVPSRTPLAEVVEEAAAEIRARRLGDVRIEMGLLPTVIAFRPLLYATVLQLCSNSVAAGACVLSVTTEATDGGIWLTIHDDGRGLSEGQQKLLTDPFAASRIPGATSMGLGVFIVRQAVARWRGMLRLSSDVGGGTGVSLWLPEWEVVEPS